MVSVVVPYVEDRGYLKQCLDSIKAQDYDHFEIITVKSPLSVTKNINIGLKQAKGKYFKVVGEDDWLPPTSLSDLVAGMKSYSWICANAHNVYDKDMTDEVPPLDRLNLHDMAQHNVIHNGTTMYRTEVLREIGGMDESLWTAEEYEMHLRLMSMGHLPGYTNKFVYFYREWNQQKSRTYRRTIKKQRDEEIKRIQSLYSD
jgi:glycosyltransferase involved in cell wall biosynthesis